MKRVYLVTAIMYSGDGNMLKTKSEICGIFSSEKKARLFIEKEEEKYYRADLIIEEFTLNPKN